MRIRRLILRGVLLAIPIGVVGIGFLESDAEAKARAFCDRFPVGTPLANVEAAVADAGDPMFRIISAGKISIGYMGMPPFSRHFCIFDGAAGKVTKARYAHVD